MTVTLTEEEWIRLLNAAALAPYAQIAPVIVKVMQQLETVKQATVAQGKDAITPATSN